jgi:phosphoribosylaminoimidazole carboxylase (NCAIR synthetase)
VVKDMPKQSVITIDHIEVNKRDIEKIKRLFKVKDNAQAIQKALDMATGKIELESIFEKHKGTKIEKIYA